MSLSGVTRGTFSNALSMRRRAGGAVRLLAGVDPGSSFKAALIALRRLRPFQPNPGNSRPQGKQSGEAGPRQGRRLRRIPKRRRRHARVASDGSARSRKLAVATVRAHGGRLRDGSR